jgi:hypothetical protein
MYDLTGHRQLAAHASGAVSGWQRMRLEQRAGGGTSSWSDADESDDMKRERAVQAAGHLFCATVAVAVVARSGRGLLPRVLLLCSTPAQGQNQMLMAR